MTLVPILLAVSVAASTPPDCGLTACTESKPVAETRTLHAAGLWTNPNELSGRPEGALSVAENVEIAAPGVLKPARGRTLGTEPYPGNAASRLSVGVSYAGVDFEITTQGEFVYYDTGQPLAVTDASTGSAASVTPPTGARVRFATSGGDLYLTTSTGPRVLDGGSNPTTAELAVPGVPRSLDFFGAQWAGGGRGGGGTPGGTGFLEPDRVVAYRAVIGRNDAEGKPQLGAPSGRLLVENPLYTVTLTRSANVTTLTFPVAVDLFTGDQIEVTDVDANNPAPSIKTVSSVSGSAGFKVQYNETGPDVPLPGVEYTASLLTRPTYLRLPLPPGLAAGEHFIQIYRSSQTPIGTSPGDDMRLVVERPLTADEINGVVYGYPEIEVIDITPDEARGVPLYTNSLQEGLGQANNRPPLMADVAEFKQCLVGVDVTRPQRLAFRFVGLPTVGDTLTLNGLGYTSTNTGTVGVDGTWDVVNDSDLTVSQQLELTAKNFIRAVNYRSGQNSLRAYYASGVDDPPGMVVVEALALGTSAFTLQASAHGSQYVPDLSAAVSSVAERIPNGVAFSKPGLPYAFPPASHHLLRIGAAEKANVRGIALRDSFWVFKDSGGPGGGIWKITGSGPGALYPEQVSESVYIIAPESLVVLGNVIYGLSNAGEVAISESGIDVLSVPIEDQIKAILDKPGILPVIQQHAVGVAYSVGTESKYILFLPTSASDTFATMAYVFNANPEIQGWTVRRNTDFAGEPNIGLGVATGAYVNTAGKLVQGFPAEPLIWTENKTGTASDYQDNGDGVPIRFGWTADSANYPNAPKDFKEQTLQLGEAHTNPWTITWTTDLGYSASAQAYPEGRKYLNQWVEPDVAYCTRLSTVWSYTVAAGESVSVLGFTTDMVVYPDGSPEM